MLSGELLTALPLDETVVSDTEERFARMLGEPVSLTQRIDPALLGSVRVEIGGKVYDDSLRGHLRALQKALLERGPETAGSPGTRSLDALLRGKRAEVRGAGRVRRVFDGVVTVSGLSGCRYGELIELPSPDGSGETSAYGIAMNLNPDTVDVVLISNPECARVDAEALCTGQVLSAPVGDALLGRTVNAMGRPIDGLGPIRTAKARPIEAPAPPIIDRRPVNRPLETGIMAIDATVPIGRGQRELIIGDRQTGKTSIAVDAILNQKGKGVPCVYVAIGQKASTVARIIETFRAAGAMAYVTVVCATASDPAAMQYIAPYCGCAVAEEYMYSGRDALIVYDDLTKHAMAYRTISLLLRRPPGREAYPGDVFYLHSRLLERAACLSGARGGGSMTALPVVETQTGDISAYIPTNVISITDGQIFLDADLFRAGTRPALNVGLSVSRVGGAAQTKAMRAVAGQLRLELAQYRELQVFSQFSSDMDRATQDLLSYGERLTEMLRQPNNFPVSAEAQVCFLYALARKLIPHTVPLRTLRAFKREFPAVLEEQHPGLAHALRVNEALDGEIEAGIRMAVGAWLAQHGIVAGEERT